MQVEDCLQCYISNHYVKTSANTTKLNKSVLPINEILQKTTSSFHLCTTVKVSHELLVSEVPLINWELKIYIYDLLSIK